MTQHTPSVYQVMPRLTAEEYQALREDIAANGIMVPVVYDQHGNVIDGHHRMEIAAELGIEPPTEIRHVAGPDEAREVAFTLNLARRHLDRWQRRELIAVEIERCPDDSDRAIGRRLGVDHKTVGSVRRDLDGPDDAGEVPHPEPKPRPRRPLPKQFWTGAHDAWKAVERLARLADDDRFNRNAAQLGELHRNRLIGMRDQLQGVIDRLPEDAS